MTPTAPPAIHLFAGRAAGAPAEAAGRTRPNPWVNAFSAGWSLDAAVPRGRSG